MAINRRQALLGAAALGAFGASGPAHAADDIVIGCVYPMSGSNAQTGVDARNALETAAAIVNEKHDLDLLCARAAGLDKLGGAKIGLCGIPGGLAPLAAAFLPRGAHLSALIERAVAEDNQHPDATAPEDTKE